MFLTTIKPQDKVMLADFNEKLTIRTDLTDDREALRKGIAKLTSGDGTALYNTIEQLFEQEISKLENRAALVLVTDGVDTVSEK